MSWKEKLFTLINTRFYTKEEIDSTKANSNHSHSLMSLDNIPIITMEVELENGTTVTYDLVGEELSSTQKPEGS